MGYPPVGGGPADDTESQQAKLIPEVWDMPATEAPLADVQDPKPAPEVRCGICPLAVRRTHEAEDRYMAANKRHTGTARG